MIELGKDQKRAIEIIQDSTQPITYIAGYAGTGKTTVLKHVCDTLWADEDCIVLTPTGKAAEVLSKKGIPAVTIHSALYSSRSGVTEIKRLRQRIESSEQPDEEDVKELNRLLALPPSFQFEGISGVSKILVDEFSMVPDTLRDDILALGIPVYVFGDPGQLPPVNAKATTKPDFIMQEIHRQALDNPIIKLSMMARHEGVIPIGDWGAAKKIPREQYSKQLLKDHEQIICGKNKTRRSINRVMRDGKPHLPVKGDRLICLKNDMGKNGLVNGLICEAQEDYDETTGLLKAHGYEHKLYRGDICEMYGLPYKKLAWAERHAYGEFDYAYAITCHKGQGSEWDSVLVIEEPIGQTAEDRAKWLYTAVTRAKNKLTIIKV